MLLFKVSGPIDLSPVWDHCHAHLKPFDDHLAVTQGKHQGCPLCSEVRALEVVAHLRFGPDYWQEQAHILHCGACQHYSLSEQRYQHYLDNALAWAQAHRESENLSCYHEIKRVNARLWSAQPVVMNIEPTTRCNFSCWYCVGRHMEQADLTLEDYIKVLDHFPSLKAIAIVGEGEPVMNKAFFPMVRIAKERGLRVLSLSNGSTFSKSNIQKICEAGIDYIGISIDSVIAETFAESRLDGELGKVLRGIKNLADYRDQHGYRYPVLGLKGTLFDHTQEQMIDILESAKNHGIDVLESFQPLNRKDSYIQFYPKDKKNWAENYRIVSDHIQKDTLQQTILPSAESFAEQEHIPLGYNGQENGIRCNCDEKWIYTLLSGDVTPCCQIKKPITASWSLVNHAIEDILKDELYEKTRFNLWNGLFPSYCSGCEKTRGFVTTSKNSI